MENTIERPYVKILSWFSFFSGFINFITIFFPLFHVNFMGFSETDLGIKYIIPFVDWEKGSSFMEYLENAALLKILLSFNLIFLFVAALISCPIMQKKQQYRLQLSEKDLLKNSFSGIIFSFIINATYFLLSVIIVVVVMNEWSFKPVVTYSFIPFILQSIAFIVAIIIHTHYKKAFRGEIAPLTWLIYGTSDTSRANTENDKVNLLIKYKELFDNGIISESEYNEMKEKILKGDGEQ